MRGIWTIACLDLLVWRRMPLAVACALIPPACMTLFLIVLSLAVTREPVALVVDGTGPYAGKMRQIVESDTDAYILTVTDAATAQRMLHEMAVAAVLTIPQDFDARVAQKTARLEYTLNNVEIDFADDIRRSVDRSVARFAAEKDDADPEREGEQPELDCFGITIYQLNLRETNVPWLQYQVIPALVLLILSVGIIGTALLCAQDIDRRTALYLTLTPQPAWLLITGRLLGGVLASLLLLAPAMALCVVFHVIAPPASHWPALIAIFVATAVCASALGVILGTLLRGALHVAMAASVTATYLFFLGGGFTTIAFLPPWLRALSAVIPTRYAIDGLRQTLFYTNMEGIPTDLAILALTALLAMVIGAFCVRRAWSEGES